MSACNLTTAIDGNQCIGDSLATINTNFDSLDTAVCNLSSNYVSQIVAGSNIAISPVGGTGIVSVSASGFGIPRAWVNFSGYAGAIGVTPNRSYQIFSSYNVTSVTEPSAASQVNWNAGTDPARYESDADPISCFILNFTTPITPRGIYHVAVAVGGNSGFYVRPYATWHSPNHLIVSKLSDGGGWTNYSSYISVIVF